MIKVVRANLNNDADADAFLQLFNRYALDPMGGGHQLSDFTKDNIVKEVLKRSEITVYLAFDREMPVGVINCIECFSTFKCKPLINVHDLYVAEEGRGKGVATKLLQAAEDLAIEKHCCKITLEVLEGNKIAQAAYVKFGFAGYELNPEMGKALFWQKIL